MRASNISDSSTVDVTDYCISIGSVGPRRLFGKNELHGSSKADQKKWRLIWGISFFDEWVEHIINKLYNDALVKDIYNTDTWDRDNG
eukprot:4164188-Amphidinium_carterae.1